jgi:hypothetical protein
MQIRFYSHKRFISRQSLSPYLKSHLNYWSLSKKAMSGTLVTIALIADFFDRMKIKFHIILLGGFRWHPCNFWGLQTISSEHHMIIDCFSASLLKSLLHSAFHYIKTSSLNKNYFAFSYLFFDFALALNCGYFKAYFLITVKIYYH